MQKTITKWITSAERSIGNLLDSGPQAEDYVESHMVLALLATICCCFPLGIVALLHASRVDSLVAARQIERARHESKRAKKWVVYAVMAAGLAAIAGIALCLLWILVATAALSCI